MSFFIYPSTFPDINEVRDSICLMRWKLMIFPVNADKHRPFRVAFFNTFIAYSCPPSGPVIFLTRNTCTNTQHCYTELKATQPDFFNGNVTNKNNNFIVSKQSILPCQKSPGPVLYRAQTDVDLLFQSPPWQREWCWTPWPSPHPMEKRY